MKVTLFDPGNFVPHYVDAFRVALERKGIETELITSPPLFDKETKENESTRFLFFSWLTGYWRIALRQRRLTRWILKALTYPQGLLATYRHLRAHPADVLHVQWLPLPFLDGILLRLIRRHGCRIVVTAHDPPPPSHTAARANQLRALALADSIVVHSASQAAVFVEAYPPLAQRIGVIPHGATALDPVTPIEKLHHRHVLRVPAQSSVLLFFGMIKRYKGLEILIDAMPSVLERFGNTHLVVAGEPFYSLSAIERQIKDLGVVQHVTLHPGYVPMSQVKHYFRAADALIAPYVGGGASGVVLAAQANALPVICSRTDGLHDLVEHGVTGLTAEPGSSSSLSASICEALANPNSFAQMGRAAWSRIQHDNSWESVAARTLFLYNGARADAPEAAPAALAALR